MRQTEVLDALRSIGRPASVREIIERTGAEYTHTLQSKANRSLSALAKYGLVRQAGATLADRGNVAYLWEVVE